MLFGLAVIVMVFEGIALSTGARWAFRLGLPLRWRRQTVNIRIPDGLPDSVDLKDVFELKDFRTGFWLGASRVGLLYWGVAFVNNPFNTRTARGIGAVATGTIRIQRMGSSTIFAWRPVLRVGPPLVVVSATLGLFVMVGPDPIVAFQFALLSLAYLGILWATLRGLRAMYDILTAQLLAKAAEHHSATPAL
ncbi:MAG: hypothetical protein JKY37_21465 [Nannocystaceae bacterium]|nr:hypothetical protein [Nannocystaceae bacterium]